MHSNSPGYGHQTEVNRRSDCRRSALGCAQRAVGVLALAVVLTGCGSVKMLENRAVCTVDGKEAHTVSKYGPLGIAARIADADAAVICKR
jgi:hypothetical protein